MKKLISLLTVFACVIPLLASAETTAELQAKAQALLDRVTVLQQQVQGGSPQQNSVRASSGAGCPSLSRNLKKGSSGADVTSLQQFLAGDPSIYPEGTVSGYFGVLTEAAVKRWQAANGIVSSGTPATTGYGSVGPRTRAAMLAGCGQAAYGPIISGPLVGAYMQITPITGAAPLNVTVSTAVNTVSSCEAAMYALDFGDGSAVLQINVPGNTCRSILQNFAHSYLYSGTYQVKLTSGSHQTSTIVTVTGTAQQHTGSIVPQ